MEYDGLFLSLHDEVYRPAEDTWILAQAVKEAVRPGDRFLEVGCGAGLVSLVAARAGAVVTATDLNEHAIQLVRYNAQQNGLQLEAVHCDLFADGSWDVVAFNPPYLPTSAEDLVPGPLNLAFDGGKDGNETVLRFVDALSKLTRLPASVFVVHSSLSDPGPLENAMARLGYLSDVERSQDHFFERLTVRRYRLASVMGPG